MEANLKFRAKIHKRVIDDPSYADVMRDACAIDPIFYVNTFGYTYDSRLAPFTKLPFLLYPFQEEGLLELLRAIEPPGYDLFVEKTRDMGASWLCVLAFEWMWHFSPKLGAPTFIMGSRDATYVDDAENDKALFWKIDYFHEHQPAWLMPKGYDKEQHRHKMKMVNPENGALITGETTTKNFARGARATAILLDEFAAVEKGHSIMPSTLAATRCRIFNSTPQGTSNAYYDVRCTNIKKLIFHWRDHPVKNVGMYRTNTDGTLRVIDHEGYPADYKPILDGKLRSPEYDDHESRSSARQMAQEWDIDYLGSGHQFFASSAIQEVIRKFARPPILIGNLKYDPVTGELLAFREEQDGHVHLWCLLDGDGRIGESRRFVLGGDISAGTGSSNSTLAAYDEATHEKILEYANPYIRPEEFARQAVAIAKWLNGALLIWENNGVGRQFGSRVVELGYGNIYYRRREDTVVQEMTQIPGWASTRETKLSLFEQYRSVIEKGELANRSKIALEETLEYVFNTAGGVSHSREFDKADPTGAKTNHGDRVVADALAYRGLTERRTLPKPEPKETPVGSLAWRREQHKKSQLKPGRQLDKTWRF
ncbi:MAG: hypothetical protein NWE89_00885 [Candidatus Bathyarchaeota archaeon]|nr:hypothetical protein [Candidatus Bathyarchaeota archaeon]